MDGHQKSWYDNGNIQSEYNYKFTKDNFNGLSENIGWQREYYENGVLRQEEFYNEITYELEKLISYREDSSIQELREFKNNEILCKEFDQKGVIKKEWKR
jgi:antitoxin component YwqK of YwqJK toxin-antitoxin module